MTHVATLISNPARPALTTRRSRSQSACSRPLWTSACSIPASPPIFSLRRAARTTKPIAERLRSALKDVPVDVVVQPVATRRKRLLVADMDSTMIGQECIDELADYVGLKPHVAAITERAMRGEIAFEPALRERVALLKGLPVATVDEVIAKRITLMPGGRTLVATMRANGARPASSLAASRCSPAASPK